MFDKNCNCAYCSLYREMHALKSRTILNEDITNLLILFSFVVSIVGAVHIFTS